MSDNEPSEKAPARSPREAEPKEAGALRPRGAPDQAPEANPIARAAFVGLWFVLIPLGVAQMRVFLLAAFPDTLFFDMLRGQPIPVSIVLFTVAAIALYSQRFALPGATAAGIGGRPRLAPDPRRRFDRARLLREESRAIRRAHAKEIERTLREEDRRELDAALDELATAMDSSTFDEQRFVAACDKAEDVVDVRLSRWRKSEAREYAESILVAVMVALAIRAFVIEAFKIPSGSMIPTLLVGDHIFVNKLAYGPLVPFTKKRVERDAPKRGDVIVFAFPENPDEDFIKRVIALPGDKLEVKDARVWLNDKPIPRCYVGRTSYSDVPETGPMLPGANIAQEGDLYVEFLDGQQFPTFYTLSSVTRTNAGPWFPKPGEVYVLGDNRNNSRDSREWWGQKGGGVPFENIRGRALWIWLSYTGGEGSKSDRIGASVMGRPRLPASMRTLQPMLDKCVGPNPPLDTAGLPPGVLP